MKKNQDGNLLQNRLGSKSHDNQYASENVTSGMQSLAPPPFQLKAEPHTLTKEGGGSRGGIEIEENKSDRVGAFQFKTHSAEAPPPDDSPSVNGNSTGLPDHIKNGVEQLSGYSLDDVKVHYNSDKPAQLKAHAFAQGSQIHVASGQEKHLAHEAWHVVQQKQGRVSPTQKMKDTGINDDPLLEREADVMGGPSCSIRPKKGRGPASTAKKRAFIWELPTSIIW